MLERVQQSIEELGYRPRTGARGMRGQTFTIAIGSEIPQIGNDFFTQVTSGAARALARSGYQLIIAPALDGEGDKHVLDALVDRQVDGIIAISLDVSLPVLERIADEVPVVLVGRHDQPRNYDVVANDDQAGVLLGMKHLLDLGHRSILHLTVEPSFDEPQSRSAHAIRRRTYEEEMARHGLEAKTIYSGASEHSAYSAANDILDSSERPTAILAGNDTLAIGALRAAAERGLEAHEVSIVGYDNIELASHPLVSLTTIDQYGERTGEIAIEMLMEQISEQRAEPKHVLLSPELITRRSTAKVA
jgi:Transcriptional regulators